MDTSIQISKVLGSKEQKARILERLERADRVVASNYVLMEFNRRVLLDSIRLHDLMKDIRMLAELLYRIAQDGFGRQKHNMILIFSHLLERYSDGTLVIDTPEFWRKLVKGLEHSMDWQLHRQFLMGLDLTFPSLINVTECSIAHQLPTKRQTKEGKAEYVYKYTCRRDEARCRLPQLLQEHDDELLTLERILDGQGANAELRKACSTLSQIRQPKDEVVGERSEHTEGWNAAKGSKNCWRPGDIIIALEIPEGYTLLTTNARHFVPLCEILGKRCEILQL